MKQIILLVLLVQFVQASTLTLKQVLASAHENQTLTQALDRERLYLEAKNLADTSMDPAELYGAGTKAYPIDGRKNGNEYTVGISKTLPLGNTQAQDERINRLNNEAYLLEEERKVLNFENGLKGLYHQHCLDQQNYRSFKQNYQEFVTLYQKKEKAYRYQEISKTELMQLEIEKNRLQAKLQEMQTVQAVSKQKLLILGRINHSDKTVLSCSDMYPIRESVQLKEEPFALSKEAHEKRIQSTQTALNRYSKVVDTVSLSVQYDQEIDIDKYSVGISVPLSFTGRRSEQERVAAMHKNAAIGFQYEQMMAEKKSMFLTLQSTLRNSAVMIRSLKNDLNTYKKELLPLVKRSYDLGESSVVEYLLNRQQYHQLNQELFAIQKDYYQTLFTLYTLSESKENQ
ncbi:MAG TPA: TolC family protein [Sulfurovum sp.]|uniref:TolC family protein n=1 Tax=Sulfurovum sp. TaxID=1969726 RepID=UPI002F95BB02